MAGIAGYFGTAQEPAVIQSMVRKMVHRGREGEAFYHAAPVFMGMRDHKAIADAQPAYSPDESIAVMFAGRISNYGKLREELVRKGMFFTTDSVAELVLHLYEAYGLNACNYLRGKFVFAVHDSMKDLVFLARDRMGLEPLYYTTTQSGSFVFGSEIKTLLEHPAVQVTPDLVSIDAYMSMGYSPGPSSMFKGVYKLPAGHRLIWNPGLHVMIEPYWQWESFMTPDAALKTDDDFQNRFDVLLEDAVHSAVSGSENPGVFLRGATEETALAALMIKQKGSVSSFAVGFAEDDTALAVPREIAKRLGTNHHEVICDMSDMEKLPEIVWALDEPVAGPEALVSHVLARSLRSETDTVLSGAGADDLLSGSLPHRVFMEAHKIPRPLHWFYRMILKMTPPDKLDHHFDTGGKIGMQCRDRLLAFMDEMRGGTPLRRYTSLISVFSARDKAGLYRETMEPVMENFLDMQRDWGQWPTMLSSMLALQKDFAIQDNTLMKLDKMSMLASVEARAPFVDHKLVEFLLGVPDHLKYHNKQNKVILRRHLDKNFPGMPEAPAKTSVLPMAKFMNASPLKDMIETCLSEASVKRRALFKWEAVQQLLARAKTEDVLYLHQVFSLLMLELWFRVYVDHEKGWISNH